MTNTELSNLHDLETEDTRWLTALEAMLHNARMQAVDSRQWDVVHALERDALDLLITEWHKAQPVLDAAQDFANRLRPHTGPQSPHYRLLCAIQAYKHGEEPS